MRQSIQLSRRRAFRRTLLCFGLVAGLVSAEVSAFEIGLDDETLGSFRRHVEEHGYECSSVREAHILYEDEIVLVVELICDNGAGF